MIYGSIDIPKCVEVFPCGGRSDKGETIATERTLPEEVPAAFVYGGSTEAVMMATPADLEDFAVGFSLNEGYARRPGDIADLSVVLTEHGIELRMWLTADCSERHRERRRRLTGPTGCGLCGIESLAEAVRPPARVGDASTFAESDIADAVAKVSAQQSLNRETRAIHAAGFYRPGDGAIAVREDVGRHNALDKLGGALARRGINAGAGAVVITSRISVEMVQKAAAIGAPLLIAISAPTALAVRTAQAANITLVGIARGVAYQVFTQPQRIR
jgi:FdhD protein